MTKRSVKYLSLRQQHVNHIVHFVEERSIENSRAKNGCKNGREVKINLESIENKQPECKRNRGGERGGGG